MAQLSEIYSVSHVQSELPWGSFIAASLLMGIITLIAWFIWRRGIIRRGIVAYFACSSLAYFAVIAVSIVQFMSLSEQLTTAQRRLEAGAYSEANGLLRIVPISKSPDEYELNIDGQRFAVGLGSPNFHFEVDTALRANGRLARVKYYNDTILHVAVASNDKER